MNKYIVSILLSFFSLPAFSQAYESDIHSEKEIVDNFLKINEFRVHDVSIVDKTASVLLDKELITLDDYHYALTYGVCVSSAFKRETPKDYLYGVEEIIVTNKDGDQGFIFKGGDESCWHVYTKNKPKVFINPKTENHNIIKKYN